MFSPLVPKTTQFLPLPLLPLLVTSAVCPQADLLATIPAQVPLVAEGVATDARADKDSTFLAGGAESPLVEHPKGEGVPPERCQQRVFFFF